MDSYFNHTKPLSYSADLDNKIYEFSPEQVHISDDLEDFRQLKRCKSITKLPGTPTYSSHRISRAIHGRRRRRPTIQLPSNFEPKYDLSNISGSDSEFSFTSNSDSDLDLESLPDLVDEPTPLSSPNPATPKHFKPRFFDDVKSKHPLLPLLQAAAEADTLESSKPSIFDIPEIVYKIVEFAAIEKPHEQAAIRRKPLTYNHALLIHGNKKLAEDAMEEDSLQPPVAAKKVLYNCSLVNKLFNGVVNEILGNSFHFDDEHRFYKFLQSSDTVKFKPTEFKLQKLFHLTNNTDQFNKKLQKFNFQHLSSIEVFMCPNFLPPRDLFKYGRNIKKIVICGSKILDDNYLIRISQLCPNLEVLDIRGCESVTDTGVYYIGKNCNKLTNINFGRKNKGHLITDYSLNLLIKNNVNLNTVGLAGCHISDKTLWDLTTYCNYTVERLSLNNCPLVTNQSIPLILHANYLPLLNVLEIRYTNIDNLKSIIEFKRRQEFNGVSVLIELCEALSLKFRQQELQMDKVISERIFNDIQDWANNSNDGDSCYLSLLDSRTDV